MSYFTYPQHSYPQQTYPQQSYPSYPSYQPQQYRPTTTTLTTPTTSSTTHIKSERCDTKYDLKDGIIDFDTLENFEMDSNIKKLMKDYKSVVNSYNNLGCSSSTPTIISNKMSKSEKKKITGCKALNEKRTQLRKQTLKGLSATFKSKTIKRIEKMTSKPNEERIKKVACSLKVLMNVLASQGCYPSTQPIGTIRNINNVIDAYEKKINETHPDYIEMAKSYIRYLIEKRTTNAEKVIKYLESLDPIFSKNLLDIVSTITECSEI